MLIQYLELDIDVCYGCQKFLSEIGLKKVIFDCYLLF